MPEAFVGVDIGLDGGIAALVDGAPIPVLFEMPTRSIKAKKKRAGVMTEVNERFLDEDKLLSIFRQLAAQFSLVVMLERPQIRGSQWADHPCPICIQRGIKSKHMLPGQSVTAEVKFMGQYDFIRGVLKTMGVAFEDVHPSTWKADVFHGRSEKIDALVLARQMFPTVADRLALKKNDGLAEALLLADYLRRRRCAPF